MMEPKIRFKGFEGEWKETKYSSFATIRRGLTYSPENIVSKGIRVLRSSNIDEDVFLRSEEDVFVHSSCINIPFAKDGDILITAANGSPRLVGKHAVINKLNGDKVVPGGFMILASSKEPYFLNSCMGAPWYKTFLKTGVAGGNGAIGNLNKHALEEYEFYTPSNKLERDGLASYFTSLDSQISASTSRLASLKQMKAASLQAMFPQEGETVPKIRFKGFEGEWKKVKLNSFAKRVTRKNSHLESTLALTIASAHGLVSQIDYFNNLVVGSNIRNYYLLKRGEFAYNKSYSNGYPFGSVKRLDRYEQGILSTLYITFSIDNSISSDYLTHFFDTNLWHKEVAERAAEGARNHGLLNIGANDFLDINIWKPESKAEQQAIASYFSSLDRQISLQSQRLEKLKQIKSACLDKMFV
ncbi:MAG: restriction endonuclease subunit S [Prevotella sp.]|nr:restriction endonuclease subunit S [Prevotella sp.]